jgi:hypothetical protein
VDPAYRAADQLELEAGLDNSARVISPGPSPHTPAATARVRTRSDRVAAAPGSGGSESNQSRRTARALRVASAPELDAEGRAAVTSEGAGSESGRWPSVGTYRRSFYAPEIRG